MDFNPPPTMPTLIFPPLKINVPPPPPTPRPNFSFCAETWVMLAAQNCQRRNLLGLGHLGLPVLQYWIFKFCSQKDFSYSQKSDSVEELTTV